MSESTPLIVPPSNTSGSGSTFYFLDNRSNSGVNESALTGDDATGAGAGTGHSGGAASERSGASKVSGTGDDGEEVLETLPAGSTQEEFRPRAVLVGGQQGNGGASTPVAKGGSIGGGGGDFFRSLFGRPKSDALTSSGSPTHAGGTGATGTMLKQRKVPIKVEPKVFFANERTFLAWLHVSVLLAGASIAIVAFAEANPWSQLYGVILLPVAIAFICYAMYQYGRRANMIRRKAPGPYEDLVGPTVLGVLLMLSIVAQFSIKLYTML